MGWGSHSESEEQLAPELQGVLDKFSSVFDDIKSLPPTRRQDHQIPLKHGSDPPNVRPYNYHYIQKEEIEKQVTEMLTSGIIRPSNSPFASPVILVKKKKTIAGGFVWTTGNWTISL